MAPKKMSAAVAPSSEVGMHFAIPEGTTSVCDINLDEDPDDDTMYGEGEGVKQDRKEAVAWFRKAAAQGDAEAQ